MRTRPRWAKNQSNTSRAEGAVLSSTPAGQSLDLLVKDRRKVHEVRIPAAECPLERGMELLFAFVADSARFAFNVRCVDSAPFRPIPILSTGCLNMRIGFVRRIFGLQFGFVRWIRLLDEFRGRGDGGRSYRHSVLVPFQPCRKARRVGRTFSAISRRDARLTLPRKVAQSGSFSERFVPLQRSRRPRMTRVRMTVLGRLYWIHIAQITSF